MTSTVEAITILNQAGIRNPLRVVDLIRDTISFLDLDLTGLVILTEAASGPYVVTPVIAALAGAKKVFALTRDSHYATAKIVEIQTRALEALCGMEGRTTIFTQRSTDLFAKADIVTNLGFVRPIDADTVRAMKVGAVIPLMCEAWEFRPGDVALDACRRQGIPVMGTNEDFPGLDVFSYSGLLCLKLLFDAQIEVYKSHIIVVSGDKFGVVIEKRLTQSGAIEVVRVDTLRALSPATLADADAVVIADYSRGDVMLGTGGDLTADEFARLAPGATVIQFAGYVDVQDLVTQGVHVFPGIELGPHRMARTLAALGPRPVVELHAAGLKVGHIMICDQNPNIDKVNFSKFSPLCQPINIIV